MDKLKPILTHKFWIFFAIALLLPLFGWWTASGSLQEQFNTRKSALDGVFNQIPNGAGTPNQPWINSVEALNQKRDEANQISHQNLWNEQLALLVWPESIAEVMSSCPYRGKIEGDDMESAQDVPDLYRGDYESELEKLWQIVEPLGYFEGAQKVELKPLLVPRVPQSKWSEHPPTWEEMWNAQEDFWLLSEIFQAIRTVNEKTTNRADSYIKRIQRIELAGGSRAAAGAEGAPAAAGGGGGLRSLVGNRPQPNSSASGDFPLTEEFGVPLPENTSQSTSTTETSEEGEAPAAPKSNSAHRYVDNGPKFRTRAFYLKVDMDHRRVPHLLVALTNSKWPLEIVRVNQIARSKDANAGGDDEEESGDELEISESALTGPNMATVVIAGLMTLHNPPGDATAEGQPEAAAADGTTPVEGQPADGTVDPAAGAVPPAESGAAATP